MAALSGSASYFMQRGLPGSGNQHELHSPPGIRQLPNTNSPFQSSIGGTIGSTLPMDSSGISSQCINVGAPSAAASTGEPVKRKRGRPRKYGADGNVSLALTPTTPASQPGSVPQVQKRGRGRPPGSGKKQQLASVECGKSKFGYICKHVYYDKMVKYDWIHEVVNTTETHIARFWVRTWVKVFNIAISALPIELDLTNSGLISSSAGNGFTPHVINVAIGEDIATKILAFSQEGPRAIFVMSATGAVSTVTLCQASTSGGSVTYEGRFEILSLSGSYLVADNGSSRNRTGSLSVCLASPDGRVIGGGVGGLLIAASSVQVILGSFMWGGQKTKKQKIEDSEGQEVGIEADHHQHHQHGVHNPVAMNNISSPNQNLTPSSLNSWPASRSLDMRNSHIDIDLMRG
ncbi:AT hook motif DNA-binding family protein [Trifolium pratense]|uniref:AT-hook motif nuclear-localized protein n=1 Tax=Trifolium pratense TaxID=57577 RepID=A0A2K3P5J6_TRIPR|nr:AT hook motif DNA-binding family protein [Trifolium pratense]